MIDYYEFQNFAGKIPPFHDSLYRKSLFKIVLGQNVINSIPI